jgi:predicted helicase
MIKALFEQVATPTKLGPLDLVEVLDWTAAALNRVDRPAFFENFIESHAVQYFYEPFLEAFDPDLRKQLGVWYTPPEIVKYMVERVDTALREELEILDGLADPRVFVLDPCCGTGAYLVEVLHKIGQTLKEHKGEDALANAEIKQAAMKRVFGFEILPAPFVVAHLQMGLLLHNLLVPLDESKRERARIFLTNALTGWDGNTENPELKNWPELEAERVGAGRVKQEKPILVILGNPPYNAYAGTSPKEEEDLVETYKGAYRTQQTDKSGKLLFDRNGEAVMKRRYRLSDSPSAGGWGIRKFNLDELYVRFFRIAERRIAEKTGRGVVSFISNHSWISDQSFVVLREHLLNSFDRFWIENMHGDRKISEYAPDGRTSETVFALAGFSPGIKQGVAISLWAKTGKRRGSVVLFRDDLNEARAADRRKQLVRSLEDEKFDSHYQKATPSRDNRFSFRPSDVGAEYLTWPTLAEFAAEPPSNGLMEKRSGALIDLDRADLETRIRLYYDESVEWERLCQLDTGLTADAARFDAKKARKKILNAESFKPNNVRRYALRPFDTRWCYYSSERPLWNEPRPTLWHQCWEGNSFVISRPVGVANPEGFPLCYTALLGDNDFLRGHAYYIPLQLRRAPAEKEKKKDDGNGEFGSIVQEAAPASHAVKVETTANLSVTARNYLANLGIENPDADVDTARLLWMHTLSIGYSSAYLTENADGVRQGWPHIPLPGSQSMLLESAALGKKVSQLLDAENPLTGIDAGAISPNLMEFAVVSSVMKGALDLSITVGWGHKGKDGVTMPGKGKLVERAYTEREKTLATALS